MPFVPMFQMKIVAFIFLCLFCGFDCQLDPFQIYWQVPSDQCDDVRPEDYNIVTNINRTFNGDKIVIFYSFGAYPYCNKKDGYEVESDNEPTDCDNPVHGGVPQAANMTLHLAQIEEDINSLIPNETFDGLAVIDYEGWRPIFDLNYSARRVYQRYSRELATKHCENCTDDKIEELARNWFELAARNFLLATLEHAKMLRPLAKWGLWEYPLCNTDAGYNHDLDCSLLYKNANRQLNWLYNETDILLPKIYLYNYESEVPMRRYHVYAAIRQAIIVKHALRLFSKPIFAYGKIEYDVLWNDTVKEDLFYTKRDICSSLKYPMEMAIDGVIIWGSSFQIADRCALLSTYLKQVVGPVSNLVTSEALKCSINRCKLKGRCVANNLSPALNCQLAFRPKTQCIPY